MSETYQNNNGRGPSEQNIAVRREAAEQAAVVAAQRALMGRRNSAVAHAAAVAATRRRNFRRAARTTNAVLERKGEKNRNAWERTAQWHRDWAAREEAKAARQARAFKNQQNRVDHDAAERLGAHLSREEFSAAMQEVQRRGQRVRELMSNGGLSEEDAISRMAAELTPRRAAATKRKSRKNRKY